MVSDVAILFLAHDGVKHSQMWKTWKQKCTYKDKLHFFVHTDVEGSFEQAHKIHNVVETKWGHKSLVLAYQNSLKQIIQNKAIKTVYLISGFDVPVKQANFLFQTKWQNVTRICRCKNALVDEIDSDLLPFSKATFQGHTQWHCLSRKHARIVAKFDYSVFDEMQENHDEFIKVTNSDEKDRVLVPDEYYILTSLKAKGVKLSEIIDDCITEFHHTKYKDPSPILWTTFNHKRTIALNENKTKKISLFDALKEGYVDKTTIFYRKVDSLVDMNINWLKWLESTSD